MWNEIWRDWGTMKSVLFDFWTCNDLHIRLPPWQIVRVMWVAQRAYKDGWIILAASASPSRAFPVARSTFKVALTSHHILEFWCITLSSSRTFLNFKGKWAVWSMFLTEMDFVHQVYNQMRLWCVEVELREAFTRRFVVAARILTHCTNCTSF